MKTVHILCLGDSLTAGLSHAGSDFHPYTAALHARLKELWPFAEVVVDLDGVPGDLVTPPGTYISRITSRCVYFGFFYIAVGNVGGCRASPGRKPKVAYDWTIVLGGTNDLGQSKTPEEITSSLHQVYKTALDHSKSAHVLALTIPEVANSPCETTQARDAVNKNISKLHWSRFHVFDLHAFFPWESMSKERRSQIWDDGIHFTPWGYDILGNALGSSLSAHTDMEFRESWEEESADDGLEKPGLGQKLKRSTHCCVVQ